MTSGTAVHSDPNMVEPWRSRTDQSVLAQKEARVRERVAALYADAQRVNGTESRTLVRRALCEAEGLCDLVAAELRRDWLG